MSTRSSLASGEGFHLYHDLMDKDETVHLRIEGPDVRFSASPGHVVLHIPIDVWEVIRHHGGATLDLVDLTDEDLQKKAETDVDERIADYDAAKNERSRALVAFCGSAVYDGAYEPREVQIKAGLEHWTKERERQQAVAAKLAKHKAKMDSFK